MSVSRQLWCSVLLPRFLWTRIRLCVVSVLQFWKVNFLCCWWEVFDFIECFDGLIRNCLSLDIVWKVANIHRLDYCSQFIVTVINLSTFRKIVNGISWAFISKKPNVKLWLCEEIFYIVNFLIFLMCLSTEKPKDSSKPTNQNTVSLNLNLSYIFQFSLFWFYFTNLFSFLFFIDRSKYFFKYEITFLVPLFPKLKFLQVFII